VLPSSLRPTRRPARGFTLVELTVAIVLLGIVALMVTNFATGAMQSYFDAERRAQLVDTTETALRRLQRDLRLSLPNSVRVTGSGTTTYLEFLPVVAGGRYRAQLAGATPPGSCGIGLNDVLNIGTLDSLFSTIGPVLDLTTLAGSGVTYYVVVYNLGAGFTNADAYASGAATGGNKSVLLKTSTDTCESAVAFSPTTFTLASPSNRFHVVLDPVTYACDPASGQLLRYSGYSMAATQPTPPAGTPALVLENVSACNITYNPNAISQRIGVVSIALARTVAGESVQLYQDVRVDNAP
jgi:MSHA biogenesis protein MshO